MKKAKIKQSTTKKQKSKEKEVFSVKKFIIILAVIMAVLIGFYFLTDKIVQKQKASENEDQEIVNVREINDINYSDVKKIVSDSYYLLLDKDDDENNLNYDVYINSLKYNKFPIEFYYIDLSKKENKSLLSDKSSLKDLDKIKVKNTTLIYVADKKINSTYEGSEKILEHLTSFFNINQEDEK